MKKNIRMLAVLAMVAVLLTAIPLSSSAESKMTVTGDFVNLRDSYKGGGTILACLRKGATVTLLSSQTYNGGWYHVKYGSTSGYIWGQYLKAVSDSSSSSTNTNSKNTNTTNTNTTGKNTNTSNAVSKVNAAIARNNDTVRGTISKQTNVRASASSAAKIVGTLKTRTTVSVLSRKNNYVYITTSKMSGYVPADSLTLNNTKSQSATVKKMPNGDYKVYVGSTGSGQVVATVNVNSKVTVLHQGSTWSYIKVGNVYGYISKDVISVNKSNN